MLALCQTAEDYNLSLNSVALSSRRSNGSTPKRPELPTVYFFFTGFGFSSVE